MSSDLDRKVQQPVLLVQVWLSNISYTKTLVLPVADTKLYRV